MIMCACFDTERRLRQDVDAILITHLGCCPDHLANDLHSSSPSNRTDHDHVACTCPASTCSRTVGISIQIDIPVDPHLGVRLGGIRAGDRWYDHIGHPAAFSSRDENLLVDVPEMDWGSI